MRRTRVTIDLGALRHNLERARHAAPGRRVMAAIKANGYGHGLVRAAGALASADALGVACLAEALELREAGVSGRIVLLEGFFHAEEIPLIAAHGLDTVVHHPEQLRALELTPTDRPLQVWLKLDTGMHRLGFPPERLREHHQRLHDSRARTELVGFMTHLAEADDRASDATARQVSLFETTLAGLPGERAIANSAGVLGWPQTHADWVRPGIMLYGVSPFIGGSGGEEGLRPAMTLESQLIAVNHLRRGERIGYGGTWTCPEDMPVGVVSIGYGDGYPRHARNGTPVLVNGRRARLVGRVSMDMLTVDLRDQPDARVGDPVVLWGRGLPAEEIAQCAETIAYELLCGVTRRVPFHECDDGGAV